MNLAAVGSHPEMVAIPASPEEVVEIVRWAGAAGRGVLPIGFGNRLRPVADRGPWVALSTRRLTDVEIYEAADLTITVGAGTPRTTIDDVLGAERQWVPFDPPGASAGTIGGLVADGFSGPLWSGYGDLRNHVLGVTLVTGDGRLLRLGGRVVKNVAGYDLIKPLVGSGGSLGVMTSICLRAYPQPASDRVFVAGAATITDLIETASRVATAPVVPASAVLTDRLPALGGPAMVLRLHGADSTVDADRLSIEAHVGTRLRELGENETDVAGLLSEARDRGATGSIRIRASVLPSMLGGMVAASNEVAPTGFLIDVVGGGADLTFDTVDAELLRSFLVSIESLGGAVRTVSAAPGDESWGISTEESRELSELTAAVRATFDPSDTLWPARQ
jgi:glycolate oxidase FAD binding subunit